MSEFNLTSPPPRNLIYFTPLRYPGGKSKLAPYIKKLIKDNKLLDGEYVEPYAGGAAIALELLFHEYVSKIFINDIGRPIYAFWASVLKQPDELCRKLIETAVTVESWDKQKLIFANAKDHDDLDLGFATLFLNRTNRSGILNGGIIGGRDQTGPWKVDARVNKEELIFRIQSISKMAHRISLSRLDAMKFLKKNADKWGRKTLIYLDPPYYNKDRDLYYDFYKHEDHESIASFIIEEMREKNWVVSYDNVPQIHALYEGQRYGTYAIGYSARSSREGAEAIFFSNSLHVSTLIGPVRPLGGFGEPKRQGAKRGADCVAPR